MLFHLPFKISIISSCQPKSRISLGNDFKEFNENDIENLSSTTGIKELRWSKTETASDLCLRAAENLLETKPELKKQIDAVIFVSQTPDAGMPNSSIKCHAALNLAPTVTCFDFNYGCSGYLYGLLQSGLLLQQDSCNTILLLVGETNSKMTLESDLQTRLIFGDAGTATIVRKAQTKSTLILNNQSENVPSIYRHYGGFSSNNFYEHEKMVMKGLDIFKFAISKVPQVIAQLLTATKADKSEIDFYFLHQANAFIINYIAKAMKLPKETFPVAISDTGNTGPASIPLMLSKIGNNLKMKSTLKNSILVGFGVGLSWGAIKTDLSNTTFLEPFDYED